MTVDPRDSFQSSPFICFGTLFSFAETRIPLIHLNNVLLYFRWLIIYNLYNYTHIELFSELTPAYRMPNPQAKGQLGLTDLPFACCCQISASVVARQELLLCRSLRTLLIQASCKLGTSFMKFLFTMCEFSISIRSSRCLNSLIDLSNSLSLSLLRHSVEPSNCKLVIGPQSVLSSKQLSHSIPSESSYTPALFLFLFFLLLFFFLVSACSSSTGATSSSFFFGTFDFTYPFFSSDSIYLIMSSMSFLQSLVLSSSCAFVTGLATMG